MQVTLVSFYRNKPDHLREFLKNCQQLVADGLKDKGKFREYKLDQIHSTLVGLERDETDRYRYYNRNFRTHRHREASMNFEGFLGFLRSSGNCPFQVQIGGFDNRDYPFTSRNQVPFERSFSIQGKNVVVMGWPLRGEPPSREVPSDIQRIQENRAYPNTLDAIRCAAQSFNILHAYHRKPTDVDNDFFFRIGMVDDPESLGANAEKLTNTMREWLCCNGPLVVDVQLCDLYVASFESEELPLETTREFSLCDSLVTGDFIRTRF